ncbi:MAG: hypothetical protein OEV93_02780 [Candidatus Moranbacteria bacterium]|nr:hypothetical protein [Candidatus Moranbacteria bacterium]
MIIPPRFINLKGVRLRVWYVHEVFIVSCAVVVFLDSCEVTLTISDKDKLNVVVLPEWTNGPLVVEDLRAEGHGFIFFGKKIKKITHEYAGKKVVEVTESRITFDDGSNFDL